MADEFGMDYYTQEVRVVFAEAEAAAAASIEILPLYRGKEWAISARWDDNVLTDLKMRAVMEKHGYRGTFYLTDPASHYYGPDYGYFAEGQPYSGMPARLLAGGNSVGAHSLTHPFLAHVSRNRMFEEVLGCRVKQEEASGSPVASYSFSFCNFRNAFEGDAVQADVAEALRRAGLYHIANHWFHSAWEEKADRPRFEQSALLPGDGKEIDDAFSEYLADERRRESDPNISFCMHVWYTDEEAWRKFEGQLAKYGGRKEWWYCHQAEYAAYRYQYRNTRITGRIDPARPAELIVALYRPDPRDLNDPVPLTLAVSGAESIREVRCGSARVERLPGSGRFDLHHDREREVPRRFGRVANPGNETAFAAPPDGGRMPFLKGGVWYAGSGVGVILQNTGKEEIRDIRITYRLPLRWKKGTIRRRMDPLGAGASWRDAVKLGPATTDYKYRVGEAFYVAQVDFRRQGEAGRLYLTCREPRPGPDGSYPAGGFRVLGPLPRDLVAEGDLAARIARAEEIEEGHDPGDGVVRKWFRPDPAEAARFDPEIVRTTGKDGPPEGCFILRSSLGSKKKRAVQFICRKECVKAIYLNGRAIGGFRATLKKGANGLVIHYDSGSAPFLPDHYGAFFRVADPETGARISEVSYSSGAGST